MQDSKLTDEQIKLFCDMMYKAFLEIRTLTGVGLSEQAAALADSFHNVPLFLFEPDFSWKRTRMHIGSYQKNFPRRVINNTAYGSYYDYNSMLDEIEELSMSTNVE